MCLQRGPHVALVVVGCRIDIEDIGRLVAGRYILAGFEQKNRGVRVGGEAVRQHAAGRASADDDVVEAADWTPSSCRRGRNHAESSSGVEAPNKPTARRRYQVSNGSSNGPPGGLSGH